MKIIVLLVAAFLLGGSWGYTGYFHGHSCKAFDGGTICTHDYKIKNSVVAMWGRSS